MFVVSDGISDKNRESLDSLQREFSFSDIKVLLIDDNLILDLSIGIWTKYTWYRVLLPDILPESIERVLYLDADTSQDFDYHHLLTI